MGRKAARASKRSKKSRLPIAQSDQRWYKKLSWEVASGIILALFPFGWEMLGLPQNTGVGIACWAVCAALAVHILWFRTNWHWAFRLTSSFLVVGTLCALGLYGVYFHVSTRFSARPDSNLVILRFPGRLLCMYNSELGKTIAPVNLAISVEVTSLKPGRTRIYSYKADALVSYQKDGRVVKESYPLFSVPISGCEIYSAFDNDLSKAKKLDFSSNGFDLHARETQLEEGESISGWMFFEIDPKIRALDYNVEEINLSLENTLGERQTIPLLSWPGLSDGESMLSSGEWHLMGGYYDLTKEHYTLTPQMDLQDVLKRHREHPEQYPPSPIPP